MIQQIAKDQNVTVASKVNSRQIFNLVPHLPGVWLAAGTNCVWVQWGNA